MAAYVPELAFVEGSVDCADYYYEYCLGPANSDPSTWRVVLRFAKGPGVFLTYEFADVSVVDGPVALMLLKRRLFAELQGMPSVLFESDLERALDETMGRILESYANWYGDWHFRRGRREGSNSSAPPPYGERNDD